MLYLEDRDGNDVSGVSHDAFYNPAPRTAEAIDRTLLRMRDAR